MLKLRKFLCGCFAFMAPLFLFVSAFTIPFLFSQTNSLHLPAEADGVLPSVKLIAILLQFLAIMILVMPLVLGVLYGMAWWAIRKGKATGRRWAIAASVAMLVQIIPFSTIIYVMWVYAPRSVWASFVLLNGVMSAIALVIGVAGLIAFWRRDAMAQPVFTPKAPRIAGDGTSGLLDSLSWLLGIAGYFWAMSLWDRWGKAHGLSPVYGHLGLVEVFAALLIVTALHEAGHALTGMALGMKLMAFIVGPFQWRIRDERWKFQFLPKMFLSAGGATGLFTTNPEQSIRGEIGMIAAGPLVNLVTGLIVLWAGINAVGRPYERYWDFLAMISSLSLVAFAVNLIPMRPEALYSDGARIYQLLRGGPWADMHRAMSFVQASLVTPVRPRDYDIEAIERAKKFFTLGQKAMLLRFFAYNYYHDRGRIPEACQALDEAETIYHQCAADIPAEWHTLFVFGNAFLKRDSAAARQWWERMQAKKLAILDEVYWLAYSALLWIENHPKEAREAWNQGYEKAQQRPRTGAYEFNRDCFQQLLDCIESADQMQPVGTPAR